MGRKASGRQDTCVAPVSIDQQQNVDRIPMTTVIRPHIPIPPNYSNVLDVDSDEIVVRLSITSKMSTEISSIFPLLLCFVSDVVWVFCNRWGTFLLLLFCGARTSIIELEPTWILGTYSFQLFRRFIFFWLQIKLR